MGSKGQKYNVMQVRNHGIKGHTRPCNNVVHKAHNTKGAVVVIGSQRQQ